MSDLVSSQGHQPPEAGYSVDLEALAALFTAPPGLVPVEISTGGQPDPDPLSMTRLVIRLGDLKWEFPVDHADLLDGGRVRIWVRRPHPHGAE